MNKKEVRNCYKMNLRHFLINYCGIDNDSLVTDLCNLSHKELKQVASLYGIYLKNVSFEDVYFDQLATGEILMVNDVYNNPAPYVNPCLTYNDEFDTEFDSVYTESVNDKVKVKQRKDDKNGRY